MSKPNHYTILARKYRPSMFREVLGQDAIVITLKNSIQNNRLAQAYLFSGTRGTGKTTLARLLAKAINCHALSSDIEPCGLCTSCKDIQAGQSLDVIEIDGASNRGIEEIRKINESVGYAPAGGRYKIYIIDEVHMLTKEAFNALLKTLEEPPPFVKFVFATTEVHKVLPTILSRCQKFLLRRVLTETIIEKLHHIVKDLSRIIEPQVLHMIALRAEGSFRDAESLLDQLLAHYEGSITIKEASFALGTVSQEVFFRLDQAGKVGNLKEAFDIAHEIFTEGKDLSFFLQMLSEHYRRLLIVKLAGANSLAMDASKEERVSLKQSADLYLKEQLLSILESCLQTESHIRTSSTPRIALEGQLLKILRTHSIIPLDHLVNRLIALEDKLTHEPRVQSLITESEKEVVISNKDFPLETINNTKKDSGDTSILNLEIIPPSTSSLKEKTQTIAASKESKKSIIAVEQMNEEKSMPFKHEFVVNQETILQFAAIELEGKIINK